MSDLEKRAIERLKIGAEMSEQYYEKPLMITYSGGKDSDICVELAIRSGINFEVQNSHTTADAPETVRYIRQRFKEWESKGIKCEISKPMYQGKRTSMWDLIAKKGMPPTRMMRYCCAVLKETAGNNRAISTGVRKAESAKRSNRGIYETITPKISDKIILNNDNDDRRQIIERCEMKGKIVINPIIDWEDSDVWKYIRSEKLTVNPLYQCGFNRVGCIGCPMAQKKRYTQFMLYPKYKQMYIHAFDRMLEARKAKGKDDHNWKNGYDVFQWWMEEDPDQITFYDKEIKND